MLCTCHLYCCYLYMYMSSTYYLGIYVLCAHYLKWSLISSFLTDNTNVIHTSSLVVFIYSIIENMLSAPLLDDVSSASLPDDMSSTPFQMTCHPHPFQMMCHPHPFWMTCHPHSKEKCLTSWKSEKQVTGQPDN